MDGTPDTGENPLAGATVSLSTDPDQVTGPDGGFMIFSSMTGAVVVTVQVVHPTGYVGTNAIPGIGGTRVTSTIILVDRGAVPFDIGLNAYASSGHWFGAVIP